MAGSFVWLERVPRAHRAYEGEAKNGGENHVADGGNIVI